MKALEQHLELFHQLGDLASDVRRAGQAMAARLAGGGKVFLCGNGGSAAAAQHIAAELTGKLKHDRRPLAAVALTSDTAALTAIGNDYGFDHVFARQLRALGSIDDCLVILSTSGRSQNVLEAAKTAGGIGMPVIGLLGRGGGEAAPLCNVAIMVPSGVTARVQEAHELIGHALCEQIEQLLGLE